MNTCQVCGMVVKDMSEYHPYAACLMFKACHDGAVVRANLAAVQAARATPAAINKMIGYDAFQHIKNNITGNAAVNDAMNAWAASRATPADQEPAYKRFLSICSEELMRSSLTSLPLKIEFGKDRSMTPEQVDKWMRDTRRMFRAAVEKRLEAAEKVDADSVPVAMREGWKLVPHQPTKEMLAAGYEQRDRMGYMDDCWMAMWYAAPQAPQKVSDTVRDAVPQMLVDVSDGVWADLHKTHAEKVLADVRDILTDSDQSHLAVRVCRALEKIDLILPAPPQKPEV